MNRTTMTVALLCLAGSMFGCGSEPPMPGEAEITSVPAGAAISIDGTDTGLTTPALLTDLEGGEHVVTVALDGATFRPGTKRVNVPYGARTSVHFSTDSGILTVTSTPPGATIVLDGEETAFVTPYTFADVDPGQHAVSAVMPHHRSDPGEVLVDVVINEESTADFDLAIASIVLFEGFSNVRCGGCPAMANNVGYIIDDAGYGPDRFLYIKYAGPVPFRFDPFFQSNEDMVDERTIYYEGIDAISLPTLYTQGTLGGTVGTPIDANAMAAYIDDAYLAPVDFILTVSAPNVANLAERDVPCEITVHAPYGDVDLAAYQLRAVLLYDEVNTEQDYDPGGDEYHWVARDDAMVDDSIGAVTPAAPGIYQITLNDPDPAERGLTPHGREVIVFAQDNSTKFIIQAGSTMIQDPVVYPAPGPVNSGGTP